MLRRAVNNLIGFSGLGGWNGAPRPAPGWEDFLSATQRPSPLKAMPWPSLAAILILLLVSGLIIGRVTGLWLQTGFVLAFLFGGAAAGLFVLVARRPRSAPAGVARDILMAAIEVPREAVAITDAHGGLVCANGAYGRACQGFPAPHALARSDTEARRINAMAARVLAGAAGDESLFIDDAKSGATLKISVARARHAPGYLVWTVEPLTDAAQLNRILQQGGPLLRGWFDALDIGLVLADAQGFVRFVNATFSRWCGARETQAGALRLADLFEQGADGAFLVRDAKGGALAVHVTDIPLANGRPDGEEAAGAVARLVQKASPLAAQRQAALPGHSTLPEQLFNEAPVGIAIVDRHGVVLRLNGTMRAILGLAAQEEEIDLLSLVAEEEREAVSRLLADAAAGRAPRAPTDIHLRQARDGVAQLYVRTAHGGEGDAVLYLADTTEQKRLELQFAQAQKMQAVGQLAGGIAHDFNNILTAMIGFCDLLLVRHGAGDASFADIMQIKQNANRAANLVRQLLAFSRQQTLRATVLVVTDVLAELSNLLRRLIGENIELKMIHGRDIGPVKVDQGQLEQVIINLAVNARDAMPDGGVLTITTRMVNARNLPSMGHEFMPAQDYVSIAVSDTGHGIPQQYLSKIFEPFFTTKEVGRGTGLGLSTVYGIVKQTGGFIFAESKQGAGATFLIYLPVHHGVQEAPPERAARRSDSVADLWGRGTVLLVEDEDAVRTFAVRALSKKGYSVLEAASGEAALDIVRGHEGAIDLVISDVVMPNMDGPTLVKAIRKLRPETKIIFISGYAQDGFRNTVDASDFHFLPKPFSLTQLAEKVKAVMSEDGPPAA
ncbi:MAG: response regulator [Pseudomonadota bacterium]